MRFFVPMRPEKVQKVDIQKKKTCEEKSHPLESGSLIQSKEEHRKTEGEFNREI